MLARKLNQKPHIGANFSASPKSARQRAVDRWFIREKSTLSTTSTSDKTVPGQYYDQESNLFYNHHRYYDPQLGRYITSDPIGLVSGFNTYLYANANSLSQLDILGLLGSGKIYKHGQGDYSDRRSPGGGSPGGDECPKWSGPFIIGWFPCDCPPAPPPGGGGDGGPDAGPGSGAEPNPYQPPGFPGHPGGPGGRFSPEELQRLKDMRDQFWESLNKEREQKRNDCLKSVAIGAAAVKAGEVGVEKALERAGARRAAGFVPIAGQAILVYDGIKAAGCFISNRPFTN